MFLKNANFFKKRELTTLGLETLKFLTATTIKNIPI